MIFIRSLGRLAQIRTLTTIPSVVPSATPKTTTSKTSTTTTTTAIPATPVGTSQNNNLISIKDSCLDRLRLVLGEPEKQFLRIQVETGGCSGFSYVFAIEDNTKLNANEDLIFTRDHYRVVVSKDILPYIEGSSVEFNESLIKSAFQVINPVAETKCSCGSSFSIDLGKLNKS